MIDDVMQSHRAQRDALRDALKALLYLQAKALAETGSVPHPIREQLHRLKHALCECSERLAELNQQRLCARAVAHADMALAAVEVERALY